MVTRVSGANPFRTDAFKEGVKKLNEQCESLDATSRIRATFRLFGEKVLVTTSGGETSAVMLDLVSSVIGLHFPVIFVDHRYHTDDTYQMIERLRQMGFDIHVFQSRLTPDEIEKRFPDWQDPTSPYFKEVTNLIKHEPLNRAFRMFQPKAWLRGIMRHESSQRAEADYVELRNGLYQVHPILDWGTLDLYRYVSERGLPVNKGHWDVTKGQEQQAECRIGDYCGTAPREGRRAKAAIRAQNEIGMELLAPGRTHRRKG